MKKLKYICAAVCAVLLCLGWMYVRAREAERMPQPYPGVPAVCSAELEDYVIHQMADDGTYLYILADEHNGIVHVFDLEGNYQHTLAFYAHLNGAFQIAAEEDTLYVRDKQNNLYLFRSGAFCEYLDRKDVPADLREMDFCQNSLSYEIRDGSVWRVAGEEAVCVIHRSGASAAYQRNTRLAAGLIVLVLFGVADMIRRRRGEYR